MAGTKKVTLVGFVGVVPELVKGTRNDTFEANGGTTTTATVDTTAGIGEHDQNIASAPADYFNGCNIYFKESCTTAALRGLYGRVTDFAVAAGTATFTIALSDGSAFPAAPAAGDPFVVSAQLQHSSVTIEEQTENLERDEQVRDSLDKTTSKKGRISASGSFDLETNGLNVPLGNGATPTLDSMSQLLGLFGGIHSSPSSRRAVAGTTVSGAGSTVSSIDVTDASNFVSGDVILVNGEATIIDVVDTAATPDNITVDPPLSSAPADTDVVYFGEAHEPFDTGHQSFTILAIRDDLLHAVSGAILDLSLSGQNGQLSKMSVEFDAEAWEELDGEDYSGLFPSECAIPFIEGRAFFNSTEIYVNQIEWALGHSRESLKDTGAYEFFVSGRDATATVTLRNTGTTLKEVWEQSGTQGTLLLQIGNEAGNCVVLVGNAQLQDPASMTEVDMHQYYGANFAFRHDFDDSDGRARPRLVRF